MSTTAVSPSDVKKLRDETGAGMLDTKRALEEAAGDPEKAREILRKKGLATAARKAGRATSQGTVASYVHHGGRVGVLVEVRCETDFVARTDAFQELSKALAMQIAVARPRWASREEVPPEIVAKEKEIAAAEIESQIKGKPPQIVEKILEGKIKRFFETNCLLEQEFLISPASDAGTVREYIAEIVAKVGENITLGRFARIEVGRIDG